MRLRSTSQKTSRQDMALRDSRTSVRLDKRLPVTTHPAGDGQRQEVKICPCNQRETSGKRTRTPAIRHLH